MRKIKLLDCTKMQGQPDFFFPSLISIDPRAEGNKKPQTPFICTHGLRTDSVQRIV